MRLCMFCVSVAFACVKVCAPIYVCPCVCVRVFLPAQKCVISCPLPADIFRRLVDDVIRGQSLPYSPTALPCQGNIANGQSKWDESICQE